MTGTEQCEAHNPLQAQFYADDAAVISTTVIENVRVARDTFRVRFDCAEIARRITPGQFVMLRLAECNDPLLGRPLALYDTVLNEANEPIGIDVVYLVGGKFTQRLATYEAGQQLEVWGPLGNGFPPQTTEHLIIVAGGIGQTPFLALAAEHLGLKTYGHPPRRTTKPKRITMCYGARSAEYFASIDDFRRVGLNPLLSTDDGSLGHRGFVTDVLEEQLKIDDHFSKQIVCCGPEPMMAAVARIARVHQVPCQVSLETPMACGIGICFTCVAKVRQADGDWDFKRTCVEGPIFDAETLVW
jgi:dihydroorotate dehydrogenase electron transfer subunit